MWLLLDKIKCRYVTQYLMKSNNLLFAIYQPLCLANLQHSRTSDLYDTVSKSGQNSGPKQRLMKYIA